MIHRGFICILFLALLAGSPLLLRAQRTVAPPPAAQAVEDTLVSVEILPGVRKLEIRKVNDSTQLQILAGNVKLKQGTSLFDCDSCVINSNTNTFEAWGHVHINDADTTNIYSNHLLYFTKKKIAYLDGAVRMTDGKGTLSTPDLEYDMNTNIGIYKHGGTLVRDKTVVTSQEGYYYADLKDVYFKRNVVLKDPAYYLKSDSLLVNSDTRVARFIADTYIRDSTGRVIETSEGFYNLNTGAAEFGGHAKITDKGLRVSANRILVDDSTQITHAIGRVVVVDSVQQTTIIAGEMFRDGKKDALLAVKKPLMIIKQDNDSIYITADTLFSAHLSDLYGRRDSLVKDTLRGTKVVSSTERRDSADRYFEAYRHVRVFSDSTQAVCDSLFYSFQDSTFRMYYDPVVWARNSQVTGDTLYLHTKNRKADRFEVIDKAFMINESGPGAYNQVKSSRMDGFFLDGNIDSVRARGFAECIYFIQDEDSAYSGINQSKSDIIDIYFNKQELQKVVFRSAVSGTIWPIRQKTPGEMRLEGFRWLEARRPKTKYELFE